MSKLKSVTLTRRELPFLIGASALSPGLWAKSPAVERQSRASLEEFLRDGAVTRDAVNQFLSGLGWDKFDAELGYIQGNYFSSAGAADMWRGIGGSAVLYTHQANGARTSFMYSPK